MERISCLDSSSKVSNMTQSGLKLTAKSCMYCLLAVMPFTDARFMIALVFLQMGGQMTFYALNGLRSPSFLRSLHGLHWGSQLFSSMTVMDPIILQSSFTLPGPIISFCSASHLTQPTNYNPLMLVYLDHFNVPGSSDVRRLLKTLERRCRGQTLSESIWQFDKTHSKNGYYYRHGRRVGLGPLIQMSLPMMISLRAFHIQLTFVTFLQHSLRQIIPSILHPSLQILTNHVLIPIPIPNLTLMTIPMVAITLTMATTQKMMITTGKLSHRCLPPVYEQVCQLALPGNLLLWSQTTPFLSHLVLCSPPPYHWIASMAPKPLLTLHTLKRKLTSTRPTVRC